MTTNRKNELIAQLVNILSELIEANDPDQVSEVKSEAVEMLTVKECTEAVRGAVRAYRPQAHQAGKTAVSENG